MLLTMEIRMKQIQYNSLIIKHFFGHMYIKVIVYRFFSVIKQVDL